MADQETRTKNEMIAAAGSGITAAEWLIMEVLWDKGPLKMADIVSALSKKTKWSRTTVLTLARRLEDKGAIGTERSSKAFIYAPLVSEKDAQRQVLEQFIDQYFRGQPYLLARRIVDGKILNKDEQRKLRDKLSRKKK